MLNHSIARRSDISPKRIGDRNRIAIKSFDLHLSLNYRILRINVNLINKKQFKVTSLFSDLKDRDTRGIQSDLVYKIDCLNCEKKILVKPRDMIHRYVNKFMMKNITKDRTVHALDIVMTTKLILLKTFKF